MNRARTIRSRARAAWTDAWVATGIITRDELHEYGLCQVAAPHQQPTLPPSCSCYANGGENHPRNGESTECARNARLAGRARAAVAGALARAAAAIDPETVEVQSLQVHTMRRGR